jgi:murein DD-endopeptidase MepM/ murein hydrolase activator NlpD
VSAKATYAVGLLAVPIAVPIIFLLVVGGQAASSSAAACDPPAASVIDVGDPELDGEQMQVAQQIVAAVRAFPATANKSHAAVIALATARQESGIRNLDYGDRDSLGAFQQRPSQGWGTPDQVMNVPHATTTFLEHLVLIPDWATRPVTDVAADVQRPAEEYRGLYEQWVPLATRLTERLWPQAASLMPTTPSACAEPATAAGVVYPVPPAFVGTDSHNWGGSGSHWSSWHTGTDFSVPCGTPVLAATAGTVEIETDQAWAGTWLLKVVTGPDSVATWYAHMQKLDASPGQQVGAGQQLGEAGARGNATGCHLHFEVHLHNGSIYGPDNANPSQWLAQNASRASAARSTSSRRSRAARRLPGSTLTPRTVSLCVGWATGRKAPVSPSWCPNRRAERRCECRRKSAGSSRSTSGW